MKKKLSLMDVKTALLDNRFRESLPQELLGDVQKFLSNPGCGCNHPIYRKVLKLAGAQVAAYFPTKEMIDPEEEVEKLAKNDWTVINCTIHDLEHRLRDLPPGEKQVEISRWQDQVTVIINNLEKSF